MKNYHNSVLLKESIDALSVKSGQKYIDATIGGGGHAQEILNRGGLVLGIDADQDAIEFVTKNQESRIKNQELKVARGNFRNIDEIAKESGFERVSGILFDLGVSSYQIDDPTRGFSYLSSGPLDMRMDQGLGVKAADLLNALGKNELYEIFMELGEERRAREIVEKVIAFRNTKLFETTDELTGILASAYGFREISDFAKAQSGKKVFQALRIRVNNELESLKEALPKALKLLESGGRMSVITFHSLEDRIVKEAFKRIEADGAGKILTKKPILPGQEEMKQNRRSKGAKLRILEKSHSTGSG